MLKKFFAWLEKGAYDAVMRGVSRAVEAVTDGQVVAEPPLLEGPKEKKRGK
jgi:hypothetical protein